MRGKPSCLSYTRNRKGITPADAGKTLFVPDGQEIAEDHPRGCGENMPHNQANGTCAWITPADAGKT